MELTVLGKYGPFPKVGGATSSYLLKVDGKVILIDCGAGSVSRLLKHARSEDVDVIIISHFHFDHSSDLGVLIYKYQNLYANGFLKRPIVYCPDGGGAMAESVINCPYFDVTTVCGGELTFLDGIDFEFFPMNHPVLTVGVKISNGKKVFSYTGDTNLTPCLEDLFENADLVVADGAFLKADWTENKPHLSVEHIVELTKKYGNKSIISHINPNYDEKILIETIGDENCLIAEEGVSYKI